MIACKEYQRQLALLSVQALEPAAATDVLAHLKVCSGCREYWARLQSVVGLYREDAERSIVATPAQSGVRSPARRGLFTWQRAAALAMAVFVLSAVIFLFRESAPKSAADFPVASQPSQSPILSIADSRRLLTKDLEISPELSERHQTSDYVYSVATRHEGL
ncbi:MAG TPA: hypothetical protein VFC26_04575 [Verrucomicrobiae bacterium]|nr:hypothetical protein [Verrucomicrobiae bacterium]